MDLISSNSLAVDERQIGGSGRPWRQHAQAVRGPQPPRSGMQIQLRSGAEFYLDGLLVECILADLRA